MKYYSPGETAERSGFSLDTLRYYDRIGLLGELSRTAGGRRRFTDHELGWLGMLRCLRDTGMPIAEMQRFVDDLRQQILGLRLTRGLERGDHDDDDDADVRTQMEEFLHSVERTKRRTSEE